METPEQNPLPDPHVLQLSPWTDTWQEELARRRRAVLRRLAALAAAALLGFTVVAWLLVRAPDPGAYFYFLAGPHTTVRRHLTALNRGELRFAYDLFTSQYREQVPFEAYHELVVSHWSLFRTREISFEKRESSFTRAVLDTHLITADGGRYLARFTLVRSAGRWLIDDVRWTTDEDPADFIRI
jgi:hypothetical protein